MGYVYCDGLCKKPHAIKLVKMAAMDLQRRDPIEAKWGGMGNFLDKELCMQPYGKGEGRGILFSYNINTFVVLKYSLTVCCRRFAEQIIKERGTSKATLRESIRGDFDHLTPAERSTMEKLERAHIERQIFDDDERMAI